jgi:hypothetical protein
MKISNAVLTLCSLSSLLGASYGSDSGALRQRAMEVVDPDQTAPDMPKAGTVIPGSYIVQMQLSADLLGINVHTLAASLGVPDDKVFQRKSVLTLT